MTEIETLTTKEALERVMSRPKWYTSLPNCTAQLAYYYKSQAKAGTLSENLTTLILGNEFTKGVQLWQTKAKKTGQ